MKQIVLIAGAGAIGSLARYGLSDVVGRWLGKGFPYGTLAVNLLGCFFLGALMELAIASDWVSSELRLALGVGFFGAFTTFSTFSVETMRLIEAGSWPQVVLNVLANLVLGLGLAWLGFTLVRALLATS